MSGEQPTHSGLANLIAQSGVAESPTIQALLAQFNNISSSPTQLHSTQSLFTQTQPLPSLKLPGERSPTPSLAPGRGKGFSIPEDERLVRCWIHISEDPIVGNDQKAESFWRRIHKTYNENAPDGERTNSSLRNRWGTLSNKVLKFASYIRTAKTTLPSGTTTEQVVPLASDLYNQGEKHRFVFLHAYNILQNCPKYVFFYCVVTYCVFMFCVF